MEDNNSFHSYPPENYISLSTPHSIKQTKVIEHFSQNIDSQELRNGGETEFRTNNTVPLHCAVTNSMQGSTSNSCPLTASSSKRPMSSIHNMNQIIDSNNKRSNRSIAQRTRRERERLSYITTSSNSLTSNVSNIEVQMYLLNGHPIDNHPLDTEQISHLSSSCTGKQLCSSSHYKQTDVIMNKQKRHISNSTNAINNMITSATMDNAISNRSIGQRLRRERERLSKTKLLSNFQPGRYEGSGFQFNNGQCSSDQVSNNVSSNSIAHGDLFGNFTPDEQLFNKDNVGGKVVINSNNNIHNTFHRNMEDNNDDEGQPSHNQADINNHQTPPAQRHFLGLMNIPCLFCKALHWIDERLKGTSKNNPIFGTCCKSGKVRIPALTPPPLELRQLYDGNDSTSISFLQHILEYNAANAFTSLGCQLDDRIMGTRGIKSFTIHGELRHRTGALLPDIGTSPMYSQLYIYDPDTALHFRHERNKRLNKEVLEIIQRVLLRDNKFTRLYYHAYDILKKLDEAGYNLPLRLHYNKTNDKRVYNMPTTDEIAILLPGDGTQISAVRDIVIHLKGGTHLERISECHPAYQPIHYVLYLFNWYD